jgi:hypothetical protein
MQSRPVAGRVQRDICPLALGQGRCCFTWSESQCKKEGAGKGHQRRKRKGWEGGSEGTASKKAEAKGAKCKTSARARKDGQD